MASVQWGLGALLLATPYRDWSYPVLLVVFYAIFFTPYTGAQLRGLRGPGSS